MSRRHFIDAVTLAFMTCCALSGLGPAQQPVPKMKEPEIPSFMKELEIPSFFVAKGKVPEISFEEKKLELSIANPLKPDPNDSPLRRLQKERCREQAIIIGKYQTLLELLPQSGVIDECIQVWDSLLVDLQELMEKPADKLKCLEMRIEVRKTREKITDSRVQIGSGPSQNLNLARAAHIDAEIDLLKFKAEMSKLAHAQQPTRKMKEPEISAIPVKEPEPQSFFAVIDKDGQISFELKKIDPSIADAIQPHPNDSPLRKLEKERCRERATALSAFCNLMTTGRIWWWWKRPGDFLEFLKLTNSLTENLLELMEKPTDKLKCFELRVQLLKAHEKFINHQVNSGNIPFQNVKLARAFHIDAEIDLLKFRNKIGMQAAQQPAPDIKIDDSDEKILDEFLRDRDSFVANAIKPDPSDSPLRKLQKERCRERAIYISKINVLIEIGKWNSEEHFNCVLYVLKPPFSLSENLQELMEKPTDKVKCYELRIEFLKSFEKVSETGVNVGRDPSQNLNIARAERLGAEIALAKLQSELSKPQSVECAPFVTVSPANHRRLPRLFRWRQ